MSFAAIQQSQREQNMLPVKDKRSLKEIQEEEQAKQVEADFLKWWAEEEERTRLEQATATASASGSEQRPKREKGKRKPKPQPQAGKKSAEQDGSALGSGVGQSGGPQKASSRASGGEGQRRRSGKQGSQRGEKDIQKVST